MTLFHNSKCDKHTWGSDLCVQGKSQKGMCFDQLYNNAVQAQNDPSEMHKLILNKSSVWEQNDQGVKAPQDNCNTDL